jgi:hypothetical protein
MYDKMRDLFPFVHSVLATTVSGTRRRCYRVPLSQVMNDRTNNDENSSDDNDGSFMDDDDGNSDYKGRRFGLEEDLHKRKRAILELFIASFRLRSQKQLKWWAIVPPIAAYSRGHVPNPPNHPLHGAGCQDITLWSSLDKLYESTTEARSDLMTHQYTVSLAFDNWQQQSSKTWQTRGLSAVFLNGVAIIIKKDKAILLPLRSIIRSPSNV